MNCIDTFKHKIGGWRRASKKYRRLVGYKWKMTNFRRTFAKPNSSCSHPCSSKKGPNSPTFLSFDPFTASYVNSLLFLVQRSFISLSSLMPTNACGCKCDDCSNIFQIFLQLMSGKAEENFQFLAADDQLYAGLQEKIKQQYLRREEQLELEYQEARSRRAQIQKDKEEVGVRLYTAQQQLASNQMDYQRAHDNFNIAQRLRLQAEQKLSQVNQLYNAKKEEAAVLRGKVGKAQKQLENLMKHYHEIESYNVQLKSDIAVTKKETFTAQDNVANLQKLKKKQDLLIDSMNQESKRLEQQKNVLTAQIISQREETEEAKKILAEAEAEMEKVVASKKGLLERWQKAILMMQKRDSAVQTARERLLAEREANALLLNELAGIKSQIRKEEEQTEKLGAQGAMIAKIKGSLELIFRQLKAEEEKVAAQYASLRESLANTEQNIKLTSQEQRAVEEAMNLVEGNIMKLHTEAKRLYESLIDQKSEHTTIEKTASNLLKQAQKLNEDIGEKEMELENILNQIARIRIDQLNTKSQIELLKKKREEALAEQNDKKYLVITYEVQIKQGHDINEKKQHEVGRLNKLHDQLMSKANDEGKNPAENKLINLLRESDELERKCNELYREWIKKQTVLVHENNKLQEIHEGVGHLQNKKMIMEQKKMRLNDTYRSFQREIQDIRISLKGLQQEMNKLNDTIADNSDKKHKLENQNVNLQSEFIEKLKEMEHEATKLEYNIDLIREEKAELINEIVECQRQILLWERKYQLEKEMQEALDPNVGQSEIEELKKELHRMELRYASLIKEQAKILSEAERAIDKRQTIEIRKESMVKKEPAKKKTPETSNQLKHAMRAAKDNQARILKSLQDTEKLLSKKEADLEKIAEEIDQSSNELRQLQNENLSLDTQRVLGRIKRGVDILIYASLQKKYKKMEQIANKTARLAFSEPVLREKLNDVKERNRTLFESIEQLADKYVQYSELLTPLLDTNQVTKNLLGS